MVSSNCFLLSTYQDMTGTHTCMNEGHMDKPMSVQALLHHHTALYLLAHPKPSS